MSSPIPIANASPGRRVPRDWRGDIGQVLITATALRKRVQQLSASIQQDYSRRDPVVVALLTGTVPFLADLIRNLSLPMRLDFIAVSSYREGTESGQLIYTKELQLDVRGRDVLLVDDILDSGKTLHSVLGKLDELKPRSIRSCVLLEKTCRRTHTVKAHYVGFRIPDEFVVGYGLDFAERYRNLPFIGVLRPEIHRQAANEESTES